jgi:nitrite reductase/ring-hydroxylating ferredoxin subunit/uncharacterized membrane protein
MRSTARLFSHPLHPMLVAFPLGLWIPSFVLDVLGRATGNQLYWTAGFLTIIGGCIGAVLAAGAGVVDLFYSVPKNSSARGRGYIHGGLNTLVLLIFIFVAARRGSPYTMPDNLCILLSAIAVLALGVSGWLGGTLSYRNQIGVDRRYANATELKERTLSGWDKPVCNQSELTDGQMMLARIGENNERIAIAKCPEGIFAMSDRCDHRGGPLSDGALVGCTVQCPWHGSQFDVRTGRVVAGPAKHKIPTYDVEIRNGEVYVSPKKRTDEESGEVKDTSSESDSDRKVA